MAFSRVWASVQSQATSMWAGGGDAGVECGTVRVAQVEHIQRFFQIPPDADGVGVALVQLDKHLVRGFQVVVQAGDLIVPHGSLDF